jgi:hypothetical protein
MAVERERERGFTRGGLHRFLPLPRVQPDKTRGRGFYSARVCRERENRADFLLLVGLHG